MTAPMLVTALEFTLKEEGGYVDNPADRGGPTNQGITQKTYDAHREDRYLPTQSVRLIQDFEVRDIYENDFWIPGHCRELPLGLAVCHFDWCVNHGVMGATVTMQQALKVTVDGVYGPATAAALAEQDRATFWRLYNALRRNWYQAWVSKHPDQAPFLKGWLSRVDRLDAYVEGIQ